MEAVCRFIYSGQWKETNFSSGHISMIVSLRPQIQMLTFRNDRSTPTYTFGEKATVIILPKDKWLEETKENTLSKAEIL